MTVIGIVSPVPNDTHRQAEQDRLELAVIVSTPAGNGTMDIDLNPFFAPWPTSATSNCVR